MASKHVLALILRHGSTVANEKNLFRSRLDVSLDEKGFKQADAAADFLGRYDLERIVTSPMLRAYQTACIVQSNFQHAPLIQDRALMPWDLGFLVGKDRELYGPILDLYVQNPYKTIPDGEALDCLRVRTRQFFEGELEREDSLTLYVAHTSNIITLSNLIAGTTMGADQADAVGPGGILAVYEGAQGLEIEPIYGAVKEPEYGVS
jgi:broad specificity phosphatase PhoE